MAKKTKRANTNGKKRTRREWTKADVSELKGHSKSRTTSRRSQRQRSELKQPFNKKAFQLGIGLGHQR